jgi:hypothetical protein
MAKLKNNIFERNPKKTIILFFLFLLFPVFMLDVTLTKILKYRVTGTNCGIAHSVYNHGFKKNTQCSQTKALGRYTLYINSLGLTDKVTRNVPLKSEKYRILFIGDSFTEGWMLNYVDTFVGIIDAALTTKQIDILNAGRILTSPIIYWRKIKYLMENEGLRFDEVVVFLDISDPKDENDFYLTDDLNVALKYGNHQGWPMSHTQEETLKAEEETLKAEKAEEETLKAEKAEEETYPLRAIKHYLYFNTTFTYTVLNYLHDLVVVREGGAWSHLFTEEHMYHRWTFDENVYNTYAKSGVISMKKYMNKLLKLLRKNGIDLTIAVYPWPSQVWHDDIDSIHVNIWEQWSYENNVKFLNIFPYLVEKGLSEDEKLRTLENYYIPGDIHFNKKGNQFIAKRFLEFYSNNSIQ